MELALKNEKVVFIDEEDHDKIKHLSWIYDGSYVVHSSWINHRSIKLYLHRFIMEAKAGQIVDHINRNKLDNRRANLRFVTKSQNNRNANKRIDSTQPFRGIELKPSGKWAAKISRGGVSYHLGLYETAEQASLAYQKAVEKEL